jgi:hypothetical protein
LNDEANAFDKVLAKQIKERKNFELKTPKGETIPNLISKSF